MTTFKNEPTSSPKTRAIGMTAPGAISIVMLPPKTATHRLYAIRPNGGRRDLGHRQSRLRRAAGYLKSRRLKIIDPSKIVQSVYPSAYTIAIWISEAEIGIPCTA